MTEIKDGVLAFLKNEMSIDIEELNEKIDSENVRRFKKYLVEAIEKFYYLHNLVDAEGQINEAYFSYKFMHEELPANEVLDSMRHAFVSFAYNGLHQLYTRQENEVWYPKIILNRVLIPNDIDSLPDQITLYRGTDKDEFQTNCYGQSWSTSKTIAEDFAFKHYFGQAWFNESERIVLKTVYSKQGVYFSNQTCEYEVAIDTKAIGGVEVCA